MASLFGNSAFTLRGHNPGGWSFSKDPRFKTPKKQNESDYMTPQSSLNARAASIGYGSRWKPNNPCGKDSPPPGTYNIPTSFNKDTGPRIAKASLLPPVTSRHATPGPGSYEATLTIGKNSPMFSFRGKDLKIKVNENPPPNAYNPSRTLTEFSGYKGIGFGYGGRLFLNRLQEETPGPGTYNHPTGFEKAKKSF